MLNFSTESLSTHRRAMEYSDVLACYYSRIEPDRSIVYDIEADELLEARSSGCALGALSYSRHQCNSRRHRYLISRRSDRADYSLQFVRTGNLTLASDDLELRLNAGDMAFIRPSRAVEYRVDPGGSETFGVHIPWRIAEALSYGEEIALDTVFSRQSGIGACVAAILEAITQTEGHFSNAESASIQTILARTLIQLGVSANEIPGPNRARREMLHTVKSVSLASLDDPELSPNGIASRVGISVRTLHRYFEASGESFWAWVRDRRLERCYEEITDPTYARHSITEIAFRWGYNELSTFDRNFRQRYGMCPRAARARGAQQVRDN